MPIKIVTLTTDFGLKDPYAAEMKAAILSICPGVGTERRPIIVQTKRGFFVGPDNGLLALAAEKQGVTGIREIVNPKLMLPSVSRPFHGRDVFAPAAAHLAN